MNDHGVGSSKVNPGTVQQRIDEGKQQRLQTSRQTHALLLAKRRNFDPIAVLLASGAERVRQLMPIKYGRMSVSPFAFFRGAVAVMAADLARLPNSGLHAQLCGDAHVQNLGSFAAPDGNLVFDINDFDETIRGPWEWDVKRMAASIVLAGRESGHDAEGCGSSAMAFAQHYCDSIREFSELPVLEIARHQVHRENRAAPIHAALLQSQRARPLDLLKKYTEADGHGRTRFRNQPPLFRRVQGKVAQNVLRSLTEYRDSLPPERQLFFDLFRSVDVGFKVVGTGSVGLRDYVVLFEGNGPNDPMFLQIKQEVASAYARYLPGDTKESVADETQGRRAAMGQRAIQPMSDLLLGWTRIGPHDYLVRQLNDHKGTIDLQNLHGGGLKQLALIAGELLARGHARSGDACRIRGYCGTGDKMARALTGFAVDYADRTDLDYHAFMAAIKKGRIKIAEPPQNVATKKTATQARKAS
jgi:uncharacterized protein (DUF2252 family)